jgi:hypothetical protein
MSACGFLYQKKPEMSIALSVSEKRGKCNIDYSMVEGKIKEPP